MAVNVMEADITVENEADYGTHVQSYVQHGDVNYLSENYTCWPLCTAFFSKLGVVMFMCSDLRTNSCVNHSVTSHNSSPKSVHILLQLVRERRRCHSHLLLRRHLCLRHLRHQCHQLSLYHPYHNSPYHHIVKSVMVDVIHMYYIIYMYTSLTPTHNGMLNDDLVCFRCCFFCWCSCCCCHSKSCLYDTHIYIHTNDILIITHFSRHHSFHQILGEFVALDTALRPALASLPELPSKTWYKPQEWLKSLDTQFFKYTDSRNYNHG